MSKKRARNRHRNNVNQEISKKQQRKLLEVIVPEDESKIFYEEGFSEEKTNKKQKLKKIPNIQSSLHIPPWSGSVDA